MDLDAFFKEAGINEYAIVRIEDLSDADRSGPLNSCPPPVLLLSSVRRSRFLSMRRPPERKPKKCSGSQNHWIVPLPVMQIS